MRNPSSARDGRKEERKKKGRKEEPKAVDESR
jgi:hypothetical protein